MPYKTPGVYVIESPYNPLSTIRGATLYSMGFVGQTEKGPVNSPVKIFSYSEFDRYFGSPISTSPLAEVVRHFFLEGGKEAYIVRVAKGATAATVSVGDYLITARNEGSWGTKITVIIETSSINDAAKRIIVKYNGNVVETFDPVFFTANSPLRDRFDVKINSKSDFIMILGNPGVNPDNGTYNLNSEGSDGSQPLESDYLEAMETLKVATDLSTFTIVTNYDAEQTPLWQGMVEFAERNNLFAVLYPPVGLEYSEVISLRQNSLVNSGSACLVYPWVITNYTTNPIPPVGGYMGKLSLMDFSYGPWAPNAGYVNGQLYKVSAIETNLNEDEIGELNVKGIIPIRFIPNVGFVIWGNRTLSNSTSYLYVTVRRTMNFIIKSIVEGTRALIFKPNTPAVWASLTNQVSSFLRYLYSVGALYSPTGNESDAFFVQCDGTLNTPTLIEQGILKARIGVRITRCIEFLIFEITQIEGEVQAKEINLGGIPI